MLNCQKSSEALVWIPDSVVPGGVRIVDEKMQIKCRSKNIHQKCKQYGWNHLETFIHNSPSITKCKCYTLKDIQFI